MATWTSPYVQVLTYNRIRAEFVTSITYPGGSLDASDTQCTVSWTYRLRKHPDDVAGSYTQYSWTRNVSGAVSHNSTAVMNISGPNAVVNIASGTATVPLTYATQTWSISASANAPSAPGGPLNLSGSLTIPARPIQSPNAPTGLTVNQISDRQHALSWTNNPTTAKPYANVEVWRSVNGGSSARVANLSGATTSWSDTGTQANRRYVYGVRATNSAGASGSSVYPAMDTTPARPGAPSAAKNAAGDIIVTRPAYSQPASTWSVREADGAVLASGLTASTWTHTDPSTSKTWRYQIRTTSANPAHHSDWSLSSNIVQLLAPPAAPTQLDPNGSARNADGSIALTWRHSSSDTTPQRRYQVRYRTVGATTWTTLTITTSSTQSRTIAAGTWTNGDDIEWQVRTWGSHADPGPYSASAIIRLAEKPTVGIVAPTPGAVLNSPMRTFMWSYYQPQQYAQSMWQVEISRDGVVVKSQIDDGNATAWNSGRIFEDGGTYVFRVRAADSNGVWSDWTSATYTVAFTGPLPPIVNAEWRREGHVLLDIAVPSGAPPAVSLTIERSIDGGPYELLAEGIPARDTEYLDWTAHSMGWNRYRVSAVSSLPSVTTVAKDVHVAEKCTVYLSGGPENALTARFELVEARSLTSGRSRAVNRYVGREHPVEVSGIERTWGLSITTRHLPSNPKVHTPNVATLEALFDMPGPHLYRDGDGNRTHVTVSNLQADPGFMGDIMFDVIKSTAPTLEAVGEIMSYVGPVMVESAPGEYRIYGGTTHGPDPGEWLWTP